MVVRSYSSFKLLKTASAQDKENDALIKEALHFWVGFALVALFESYLEMFVSWVPLYSFAKLALLWYMILPQTKGSTVLFENFIEPKFRNKVRSFETALLEGIHAHVLTYTEMHDHVLAVNKVNEHTDEELEALLLKAQRVNALVEEEKERRRAQQLKQLLFYNPATAPPPAQEDEEEFIVVTPPLAQPKAPLQQQQVNPSYFPTRGFTSFTTTTTNTVYVDDVPVAVESMRQEEEIIEEYEQEDSEEDVLADETLNMIDSPSSSGMFGLGSWMPSSPGWSGMQGVLSFATTPARPIREPPPPPLVVEKQAELPRRRSSSRRAQSSPDVHQPASFANRILTRSQAAAAKQQ